MSDYRVLVTGGSRGIGRGIALALARKQFSVAVNALEPDAELDATLRELRALGVKAEAVIGDVADLSRHETILDEAERGARPADNSGQQRRRHASCSRGDLLDATPESYDRCQAVNSRAAFFLTQRWAKRILSRRRPRGAHRCVITISSSNAVAVSIERGEYCVSKAGASMIAKLFAVRLGAKASDPTKSGRA